MNNNRIDVEELVSVVICSHFSIFANNEQPIVHELPRFRRCDLLSF